MSPAAAEFASACKAPGPPADDDVVAVVGDSTVVVDGVVAPDSAVCFDPPQPAAITPKANRARNDSPVRVHGRHAREPARPQRDRRPPRPVPTGSVSPANAATDPLRTLNRSFRLGSSGHPGDDR